MFILKKGHQPGVYVPLRALFLVLIVVRPGSICIASPFNFGVSWQLIINRNAPITSF